MAQNNLTPQQDLVTREFYTTVASDDGLLPSAAAHARQLRAICLALLNYIQLPNGAFIQADTKVQIGFGSNDYSAYPNEWEADERRSNEAIMRESDTAPSTRSQTAYSKVREAVLPKDV